MDALPKALTEATPAEYSVAAEIHAVAQAAYALEAERIGFAQFPPLRESLEELSQSSDSFLVFQQSGSIIGGLSYRRGTDTVAITRLVVSPEHLRRGIATALLSELESRVFPIARLTVSTAATNAPAISLYERFGFKTVSASMSAEGIPLLHLFKASAVTDWSLKSVRMDLFGDDPDYVAKFRRAAALLNAQGIKIQAVIFTDFSPRK